jgi:hypothetical protein
MRIKRADELATKARDTVVAVAVMAAVSLVVAAIAVLVAVMGWER